LKKKSSSSRFITIAIIAVWVSVTIAGSLSFAVVSATDPTIAALREAYSSGDQKRWPIPDLDEAVKAGFQDIGHLPDMPVPADNPITDAKKELGKLLFYDPRISVSGQIACASCHDPQLGWGDGKRFAFGHDRKLGKRNAMTLFNTGYYTSLFWDGRASSLEHQAQFPVQDHLEMNQNLATLEKKVRKFKGYRPMFKAAFGSDAITLDRVFKAIATFERSFPVSPKSRFDLFIDGKADALTDEEVQGLHLFRTKARCINCHNTGLFSDNRFHNDGQTLFGSENEDLGLYNVTKKTADVGKFRTPSLREIANTGPWMHHGNFPTLKDVVLFYNLGNPAPIQKKYMGIRDSLLPVTSPILRKLQLSDAEVKAVLAFLQTITTTPRRLQPPEDFPK
jgi:cytochrome c peroxidase